MAIQPDEDELRSLMVGADEPPAASQMPDPEPEVVARAQEIIDEVKDGKSFSTVQEGNEAKRELRKDAKPLSDPDLTEEEKLAFLAHLFGDKGFSKEYEGLDGRLRVGFVSVNASFDAYLSKLLIVGEERRSEPKGTRKARYRAMLLAASVSYVFANGEMVDLPPLFDEMEDPVEALERFEIWLGAFNREEYRLLRDWYDDFQARLDFLLGKVNDPVFWPTP